jgi:hypothetical protein
MLLTTIFPALLLIARASAQVNTKSYVTCLTKQGAKSTSPVKTVSQVLTLPFYAYRITTSTPSVTTTPATSTVTVSTTDTAFFTTTLPAETDTITTTSTEVQTLIITENTITTTTTTTTSTFFTTSTTTIAASAGFIPVESSIPGSLKRSANIPKPALGGRQTKPKYIFTSQNGKVVCSPTIYPQSVKCVGIVAIITTQTRTRTATTTATITAATPVFTSTASFSTIITVTITPDQASTTTTVTESSTVTTTTTIAGTTITQTLSQTVTQAAPQATYYAACADNNIITTINGQGIISGGANAELTVAQGSGNTAYDCCVNCLLTPGCGSSLFHTDPNSPFCILNSPSGTCSQSNLAGYALTGTQSKFALSNGYCGHSSTF